MDNSSHRRRSLGYSPYAGLNDAHFYFSASGRRLYCRDWTGRLRWSVEARGEGIAGSYDKVGGDTPPGIYRCGRPEPIPLSDPAVNAYGRWFVDLEEMFDQEVSRGRAGIGVHGGGSEAPKPLAPRQGWFKTLGCIRLQNQHLHRFVAVVQTAQALGARAWLQVGWK